MKKVLFIASIDFNKYGGGAQAVRAFIDSTIDIFGVNRVDIMVGCEYEMLEEYKNYNYIRVEKRTKLKSCWEVSKGYVERWSSAILSYIKKHREEYGLLIINSSRSGTIIPKIKKYGINIITIHHNDEVEYCMDNKNMYTFGGKSSYFINRAQKMAYKNSDINVFLTKQDKLSLNSRYGDNNKKNIVLGLYDYKSAEIINPHNDTFLYDIGLSGSLCDYQTVHGIMSLRNNYYDIIKKHIPHLRLLITGREPSKDIFDFVNECSRNVFLVPSPKDIHSELKPCAIYMCPTDIGGGLKLRVMDGLKLGKPILVHQVSARGYDMFKAKPYFRTYNDRESFEQSLKELIKFVQEATCDKRLQISNDYYSYFGYNAGTRRFKELVKILIKDV